MSDLADSMAEHTAISMAVYVCYQLLIAGAMDEETENFIFIVSTLAHYLPEGIFDDADDED